MQVRFYVQSFPACYLGVTALQQSIWSCVMHLYGVDLCSDLILSTSIALIAEEETSPLLTMYRMLSQYRNSLELLMNALVVWSVLALI